MSRKLIVGKNYATISEEESAVLKQLEEKLNELRTIRNDMTRCGNLNPETSQDTLCTLEGKYNILWEEILKKYFDYDMISQSGKWECDYESNLVTLTLNHMLIRPYDKHMKIIQEYQNELGDFIQIEHHGASVTTHGVSQLSKGCQSCKNGTWLCVFISDRCNSHCKFCPQSKSMKDVLLYKQFRQQSHGSVEQVLIRYDAQRKYIDGVSYSGGEPLMELGKILRCASYIQEESNGEVYQWVYTNGILLTEDILKQLKDVGIQEVRMDLVATDFNPEIMKKLEWVRKYMNRVTVEVPMVPETYKALVTDQLLKELPIDQLNLAEFILYGPMNWSNYTHGKEVVKYNHHDGHRLAESSDMIYQTFLAAKEWKIPYVINNCNALSKFLQKQADQFRNTFLQ